MLTEAIATAPAVRSKFRTRIMDLVAVKGKTEGVRVHEALSRKDDMANAAAHDFIVEKYEVAFNLYLDQRFVEALAMFEELQAGLADKFQMGPDKATELLIKRVQKFIDNPPGADWDGVDKVKSKAG